MLRFEGFLSSLIRLPIQIDAARASETLKRFMEVVDSAWSMSCLTLNADFW